MSVNSITSPLPNYLLPFNSTANNVGNANSASSAQQADVLGLSPEAQFLNQLQQVQTQSPQQFQAILSQITGQLQQTATTASNNGNTTQADQLTQLANSFQSAANGGTLPTAQQLQQAGLTGHHHHEGGHHHGSAQSSAVNAFQSAAASDTQNQSLAASIFGTLTPAQTPAASIWSS
jgi:hypothetical protein